MHTIEPYHHWRDIYIAEEDEHSPFYGRTYSEFTFSNRIYNYLIHPQWDDFGCPTLYAKIIYADYESQFTVIELIGEWNDCLHNDIMTIRDALISPLLEAGICKFFVSAEHVLNFHSGDDDYYIELYEDIQDQQGWFVLGNPLDHVLQEMTNIGLHNYITINPAFMNFNWRKFKPQQLKDLLDSTLFAKYLT